MFPLASWDMEVHPGSSSIECRSTNFNLNRQMVGLFVIGPDIRDLIKKQLAAVLASCHNWEIKKSCG